MTYSNAIGVVSCTMCAYLLLRFADMDSAIAIDYEVEADAFPATGFVPAVNVGYSIFFAFDGGRTVDNDLGYLSHSLVRIPLIRHRRVMRKPPRQMPKSMRDRWSNQVRGRCISFTSEIVTSYGIESLWTILTVSRRSL